MGKKHEFDPGYSGMSTACNHLVLRGGFGDTCGQPQGNRVHTVKKPKVFTRVGVRMHYIGSEPAYVGQPEVGLCGTVFIRQEDQDAGWPSCLDCALRQVDRFHVTAKAMLQKADDLERELLDFAGF